MSNDRNDDAQTPTPDDATPPMAPTPPTQPVPTAAPAQPAAPAQAQSAAPAPQAPVRRSRTPWLIGGAVAGVLLLGGAVGAGVLIGRSDDDVVVQRITSAQADPSTQSDPAPQSDSGTQSSSGDQSAAGNQSGGTDPAAPNTVDVAIAQNDDIELVGDTLTQAAAAAMQAAGGEGTITSAEVSDDPTHRYEVEVTRADGAEMDVYLDADFQVVATKQWHR